MNNSLVNALKGTEPDRNKAKYKALHAFAQE